MASRTGEPPPLVLHVLYRFATGGLENGVVNLINHMPPGQFRHAILAIDSVDPAFAVRVHRADVTYHELHKPPGHAVKLYPQVWRLLRQLRPAVMHSRNLAALELQLPALLAGVPVRIHGEHGRDVEDLDGSNRKLQRLRRMYSPTVHRYITVSQDLRQYLLERVGIAAHRVEQIYNGVDTKLFFPVPVAPAPLPGCPFDPAHCWIVGTVGRLQSVKNQALLLKSFLRASDLSPALREHGRLAIVGSGPSREELEAMVRAAGASERVWLAGERHDVPQVMRGLHTFVLPSMAEGISNTILEAMASGLPVLATAVGGNAELVKPMQTGMLVPTTDVEAMAAALVQMFTDRSATQRWGLQAREVVERHHSIDAMVSRYAEVYLRELRARSTMR